MEAFREAAEPVIPAIWRCLRRFGVRPDELDDALQTVLVGLFRNWERLSSFSPEALRSYACCASVGVARDVGRSRSRTTRRFEPLSLQEDLQLEAADDDPETRAQQREALTILEAVLKRMPDELRDIFVLHVIEQLSKRELASHLGIPEGTAASRIRRAREEFARALSEVEQPSKGTSP
ncbi:RNA polymerase sigma factor [Labilithrix luteola]|uniref:RNA polymerase sigma factor n=1 Tax=Labilithrix luteola TaxID=1391654 RepID=UPI001472CC01|nr:sigma-70 family RNA polymerase sigma factor [Labilithrix luteola]